MKRSVYRIVFNDNGKYNIQKRFLYFFWIYETVVVGYNHWSRMKILSNWEGTREEAIEKIEILKKSGNAEII